MKVVIIIAVLSGLAMANFCLDGCYTATCVNPNKTNAAAKKICDNAVNTLYACGDKNCNSTNNPFQCIQQKCIANVDSNNFWKCAISNCRQPSSMNQIRSLKSPSDIIEFQQNEGEIDAISEEGDESYLQYSDADARSQCRAGCVSNQCKGDRTCINGLMSFAYCVQEKCMDDNFSEECAQSKCKPNAAQSIFVGCLEGCVSFNLKDSKSSSINEANVIDLTKKTTSKPAIDDSELLSKITNLYAAHQSALHLSFVATVIAIGFAVLV